MPPPRSERERVMEKIHRHIIELWPNQWHRARGLNDYLGRLEQMTDDEYDTMIREAKEVE